MIDQARTLNWLTGRMTDQQLADAAGIDKRLATHFLSQKYFDKHVSDRGRGSRRTRRVSTEARNAIAIIAGLQRGGISAELASSILTATPVIADAQTEIIDFTTMNEFCAGPLGRAPVSLLTVDPDGGWNARDSVPQHIWNRQVFFVYPQGEVPKSVGGLDQAAVEMLESAVESGLIQYSSEPLCVPEIDPLGTLDAPATVALPNLDEKLLIVDRKWVVLDVPQPGGKERIEAIISKEHESLPKVSPRVKEVLSEVSCGSVRPIPRSAEFADERVEKIVQNAETIFSVNLTLSVRRMKRRALGLDGGGE